MADTAFNPLALGEEDFTRFVANMAQPPSPSTNTTTSSSPAAQGLAPEALNALAEASRSLG